MKFITVCAISFLFIQNITATQWNIGDNCYVDGQQAQIDYIFYNLQKLKNYLDKPSNHAQTEQFYTNIKIAKQSDMPIIVKEFSDGTLKTVIDPRQKDMPVYIVHIFQTNHIRLCFAQELSFDWSSYYPRFDYCEII